MRKRVGGQYTFYPEFSLENAAISDRWAPCAKSFSDRGEASGVDKTVSCIEKIDVVAVAMPDCLVHCIVDTFVRFANEDVNMVAVFLYNFQRSIVAGTIHDYVLYVPVILFDKRKDRFFYRIFCIIYNAYNGETY